MAWLLLHARADGQELDRAVLEGARRATAYVEGSSIFGDWSGSAFLIARTSTRLVLATNAHVAAPEGLPDGSGSVRVTLLPSLDGERTLDAQVAFLDRDLDLAYLVVEGEDLPELDPIDQLTEPGALREPVEVPSPPEAGAAYVCQVGFERDDGMHWVYPSEFVAMPPDADGSAPDASERLKEPLPDTIPASRPFGFEVRLKDPTARPRFKGLELPEGCSLDPATGFLAWPAPTRGEHALRVKVFIASDEYFVVEHVPKVE